MLWNKANPSKNVNDLRKDKDVRSPTGTILASGLIASLLAASAAYWAGIEKTLGPEVAAAGKAQEGAVLEHLLSDDAHRLFVESVLGSSEEVWTGLLAEQGKTYAPPTLVLFDEQINTGCGPQRSDQNGLLYCPADQQIYIDLKTLEEVAAQSSTVSDFAQAYVIAHEISHHIQNELGVLTRFEEAEVKGEKLTGANGLSVRLELQADCLAGVWARHAQERFQWLEAGDINEALMAASMFGDDYLMREANRDVTPEKFTHGTSEQRIKWFNTGFKEPHGVCTTFDGAPL